MNVDRTHKPWVIALLVLSFLAVVVYALLPSGGSASSRPGLVFGLLGFLLALFCGLLPVRKKLVRIRRCARWRILAGSVWEKGHVYLGLLGCLFLHLHACFRSGGPLSTALMVVLWVIIASGLVGLLFRHLLVLVKSADKGKALVAARVITAVHRLSMRLHVPLWLSFLTLSVGHAVAALYF